MCKINNVALALEICAYFLQGKMAFQLIKLCQESQLKLNTDCHQASHKQYGMGWQLNTTDCANSDKESLYSCTTQCGFQAALHTSEARALCIGKLGLHPYQKMHLLVDGVGGNAVAAQMQPRTPGSTAFGSFSPPVLQREPQT